MPVAQVLLFVIVNEQVRSVCIDLVEYFFAPEPISIIEPDVSESFCSRAVRPACKRTRLFVSEIIVCESNVSYGSAKVNR